MACTSLRERKKKLVNSNIKYKKRPRSECASTINTLPSTCTSAPGTAGKPFHLKSLIVNFLIYKMGVIERKKKRILIQSALETSTSSNSCSSKFQYHTTMLLLASFSFSFAKGL